RWSASGESGSPAAAPARWCQGLVKLFTELGGEIRDVIYLYAYPRAGAPVGSLVRPRRHRRAGVRGW
ncbi:hypothetical protein, partial [Cronobacter malonaticus]|uniref:hypothetical protein n=1 Tax=Cronobacter malonaticus TaxID=413503 RepID=UPI001F1F4440